MKELFNRIFKTLLITIFIIGGSTFFVTTYFSDDIEDSVINTLQNKLETSLLYDQVEFTIYDNFPSASVKITNLLALESSDFNNDTLIYSKKTYFEISLFDIINKSYDLKSIIVTDAQLNIKYNTENIPNFLIFKTNPEAGDSITINKIIFLNTEFNYLKENAKLDMSLDINRSIISIDKEDYTFNTSGFSNKIIVSNSDYLNKKKFNFTAKTKLIKDTFNISKSKIEIEGLLFEISGGIYNWNAVNLKISGEKQDINKMITNIPYSIQKTLHPFIANGNISFNSYLKGTINKEKNPSLELDYHITEGEFKLKNIPFSLNNIQMSGSITNGETQDFHTTKIEAHEFKARTNNGYIDGVFTLSNLNNYFLNTQFTSSWDMSSVNQYFEDSPFIELSGKLFSKTNYKGNISFNNSFKKMFLSSNHKSDIIFKDINFYYKIFPLKFSFEHADCEIKNNTIVVKDSKLTISETDLNFKGEIVNLIAYILNESPKIYLDGITKSTYTNFSEIMTFGDLSDNKANTTLPNWIYANTNLNIMNLSYNNFTASNIEGDISYKKNILNSNSISATTLNGEVDGSFILKEPKNKHLQLLCNLNAKEINIRNSFDAFNNYGQSFIKKENLKGIGTAQLDIEVHWDPNFILNKKKLKAKSHLIIEKGELIDFSPLESLSSYVSVDELRHVKFSNLENTIEVADEIITIPTMEIKSSALSLFLSGIHSFKQNIDYDIKLLLSELLSSKFRKENTEINKFGVEEKDGEIFNTVYLKMTGNTENPKISLNKIRFMEDVTKSIKKEKKEITKIIKEDILQTKDKTKEKGQEIDIEWEPEL
tara:strand:- start:45894 stop:48365 length:2472 start_codon:yes stop_codon:yes gene_type:complete